MRLTNQIRLRDIRRDAFGGVTAAIVALPLALAFGVASGAGAMAGLYGAVAVGFFAALFGGTPTQISGPTGPMTVVFAAVVTLYSDNLAEAFAIVTLGGLFQIGFGAARLGRYVQYTPISVVSGFMTGVGVIIILIQLAPFVGAPSPSGPMEAIAGLPALAASISPGAVVVGGVSLAAMALWPRAARRFVPAPLAALILATLAAALIFPDTPRIGDIPRGLPALVVPHVPLADLPKIVQAAFVLALLGSIDSLLTSLVADSITRTRHQSNRELIGQGVGNAVAGLIGGLPGAGATMRTVVNVRAGAVSATSGMIHAAVLLAVAAGLGGVAEIIPLAALAGILIKVGWDIIDWGYLRRIARAPREKAAVMLVTLGLTVTVDLITAVAVGLILAGFVAAASRETDELAGVRDTRTGADDDAGAEEREALAAARGRLRIVSLTGAFSVASAREVQSRLAGGGAGEVVILDLTGLRHADLSAALAIEQMARDALDASQGLFLVTGPETAAILDRLGALDAVPAANRLPDRAAALRAARAVIDGAILQAEPSPATP